MPAARTEITEIVTGLAMLGGDSLQDACARRPEELVGVDDDVWRRLEVWRADDAYRAEFAAAWANGQAFLRAEDALRERRPRLVEWKGNQRVPGGDPVPADLRVDHVYLVSCKYLSRILVNASPAALFDHALDRTAQPSSDDWYLWVARDEYQALYAAVRGEVPRDLALPPFVGDLTATHRRELRRHVSGRWSAGTSEAARDLAVAVGRASAARWRAQLARKRDREQMLWRLLRITSAPYFVLGASRGETLRLRIATPWDWRRRFDLRAFEVWGDDAGQPQVRWRAEVRDRERDEAREAAGHVEVRWAHGRFAQVPEAKVYLDTPHREVPGYFPLG